MALISFGYRVDMFAIDPPLEVGSYIVAYDLDGVLKQKDHLGVVTLVGAGAGGPQGPPGPVGPAGLTWSGYWVATQSYSLNYAVGYASASWWCISDVTGATSNPGPDVDTTHWALLAAQGSPGSQGGTGSQGLQGSQGPIGINWIGDWIVNVYDVRDAVYYNGSSYVCIASTVGTETLSPDTNTACWDIISLKGDVGPQGATGSPGVSGATGSTLQDIFYNIGGTVSATNSTSSIYRTGNIGIGTASPSTTLHVYATQSGAFRLEDGTQGNGYILKSDSNGVATWTPLSSIGISGASGSIPKFTGTSSLGDSRFYEIGTAGYYGSGSSYVSFLPAGNTWLTLNRSQAAMNFILGNPQTPVFQLGQIQSTNTIGLSIESAGYTSFNTGPTYTEKMRITSGGNVGIGLTAPSTTLHVYATQSGALRLEDGTQGNGYILTSDANGVATWTASIYATDSNVVHKTGDESISGIKTFTNTGFLTSVVVQNYNTNPSSSALESINGNGGMGIKSENTSSGIGIYSNSTSTGLNYVGANNGVTTFSVNKTGAVSIGTGTASNSRFVVSSSGGTTSFYVNEAGDSVFRGDTKIIGATFSPSVPLPPGSITFGSKTAIYPPGDNEIVIGTDTLFRYGWKFTSYQITNLWGNTIEFQNIMGTIGNLFVGSNYTFAGYNVFSPSQQSTLFVKGTTASIMRVVGIGATWSNSQSIFEINNNGAVSIGTSLSMSGTELFIQSNTASTTIGSNVMLDLYNGQLTGTPGQVSELAFSADTSGGGGNAYNTQHRYAIISGYATTWNGIVTGGGIKFSTRATTGSSLVTSLVLDPNGGVYNQSRGITNTIYGYQALLTGTVSLNNTAFGYQALYSNTVNGNFAIGYTSLYSNSTGEQNTALGNYSLYSNTTGFQNTAIGVTTLYRNKTSSNNVAIGYQSMYSNTTGSSNTALGNFTLHLNTTTTNTLTIIDGGSGYTASSTFSNVQLSYISGTPALTYPIVTVYVGSGGTVSTITLQTYGTGFIDTSTIMGANLGTGFTFSVSPTLTIPERNVAVGYSALYSNIKGSFNTAIGYWSLYANTLGSNNTALGYLSLNSNTTGTNCAVGSSALRFNTTGTSNTAIGTSALQNNTIGINNVAVGHYALLSSTQSYYNTAIGNYALYSNTSGQQNVAIGNSALQNNTTGSNIAIGMQTLFYNTTGTSNTAIGASSLFYNTTGTSNTAIGVQAGTFDISVTGVTNSNTSIFIGDQTKPQGTNQSNQIVIGYGATGNGSNSVTLGNDDITRTYLKGSVVIADGTQGNGYILTSDTNGVASWTASFALGVIATSSNITTDTLDINGLSQRGRCIIIDNGTYSINLTVNGATGFSSTYLKHGTASVTFVQGSGRTLVQVDGTAVLNGVAGSTATLLSYGTTDYLRINNA